MLSRTMRSTGEIVRADWEHLRRDGRTLVRHLRAGSGLERRSERRRTAGTPDAVFLHVPKTAGTSIFAAMQAASGRQYLTPEEIRDCFPQQGIVSFGHIRYLDLLDTGLVSPAFAARAFRFAVVRNPFDRAVSLYEHMRWQGSCPKHLSFDLFAEMIAQGQHEHAGFHHVRGMSQCAPQGEWLFDRAGTLIPDEVGRFEDLGPLLRTLRERGIVRGELGRANVSDARRDQRYYSSSATRRNIAEAYRSDLEAFSY